MCSKTIHSNHSPKRFVQGRWADGTICRKYKGTEGGYEVVVPSIFNDSGYKQLAWGSTPMKAWWEASNVR